MFERADTEKYSLQENMYILLTDYKQLSWLAGILIIFIAFFVLGIDFILDIFDLEVDLMIVIYIPVLIIFVFYSLLRLKKRTDVKKILDEYIRQNYYLSFQMLRPQGKDKIEKFMSLAVNVFPSLKKVIRKFEKKGEKWQSTHDKLDGNYKFDISLETEEGKFLVKYFENTVKFEDIEKIVDIIIQFYRKKDVLRVVCVAEKYDDLFLTDELSKKMNKLLPEIREYRTILSQGIVKSWIGLDLILERENGYTMIWID